MVTNSQALATQVKIMRSDEPSRNVNPSTVEEFEAGLTTRMGAQTSFSIAGSLAAICKSVRMAAHNGSEIVNLIQLGELKLKKGFLCATWLRQFGLEHCQRNRAWCDIYSTQHKAYPGYFHPPAGADILVYNVAIGNNRRLNQSDNKEPAMDKGILLSEQERVAFKMISTGNDLHGKRATALLAIDEGSSQVQAAQLSGLTPGQVKYWLGKFRDVRMEIFPETVLETEQTDPTLEQAAQEPAAVEPLDKAKKPEPAKNKQKTKQKSKRKKGKKSKAKKGKGKNKKKKKKNKKKKGSGKKGTKK